MKSPFATLIPISLLLLSTERGRGSLGYSSNHPKIYYTNLLYEVNKVKEKYEQAHIEIIEFKTEDVITTSSYIEMPEHEFE